MRSLQKDAEVQRRTFVRSINEAVNNLWDPSCRNCKEYKPVTSQVGTLKPNLGQTPYKHGHTLQAIFVTTAM